MCSNYKGITRLSLVLDRRVRREVEPQIQEDRCGFRPGRGRVGQLSRLLPLTWNNSTEPPPPHDFFLIQRGGRIEPQGY